MLMTNGVIEGNTETSKDISQFLSIQSNGLFSMNNCSYSHLSKI